MEKYSEKGKVLASVPVKPASAVHSENFGSTIAEDEQEEQCNSSSMSHHVLLLSSQTLTICGISFHSHLNSTD